MKIQIIKEFKIELNKDELEGLLKEQAVVHLKNLGVIKQDKDAKLLNVQIRYDYDEQESEMIDAVITIKDVTN